MRLKPQAWFLISLLLFAAAICMWRYGNKYGAEHQAAAAATAKAAVSKTQHPALVKTLAANTKAKRKSYRLTNTSQTIAQLLHNSHALILRNAWIDTEVPVALKIPANLRAKGAPGSYLVQADRPLDTNFYAELSRAGASYISYVPNNAALVEASPEQATNLAANADVVAVLPYEPYYKLDTTLLPSAVDQQNETNTMLSVTTFPGQRDAALAALTQLGANLMGEDRSPFGPTLVVSIPPQNLDAVAQLPLAQEVEAYLPRRTMNDLTRVIMAEATNTLFGSTPTYLGLSGKDVLVSLNDTGADATHPDLAGRILGYTTDSDGHGTHVAGIIAGSGKESLTVQPPIPGSITNASFQGKATNAALFVQSLDLTSGPYVSDSSLQVNASIALGSTNLISNNSWDYDSTAYDTHAASYDAATRDAQPNIEGEQPLLFVFAAGNSGDGSGNGIDGEAGTILSPALAKNVITVGASDSPRYLTNLVTEDDVTTNEVFYPDTDNSNLVASFSSGGNVDAGIEGLYGRFKPDVVAPGVFTISCRASDFVDPSNETLVTAFPFPAQTVALHQTNIYPIFIPSDTSELILVISSNSTSPSPFPNMLLLGDPNDPPTDVLSSNNFLVVSNFQSQFLWFFGVASPSNQPGPVNYDLNFYIVSTNSDGDYYTVLSDLDNPLLPYYRYESGTSMAAGAVSGTLALMQEFLQQRMGMPHPSPALLKAMLINGSQSLGLQYDFEVNNPGVNEQGWGLPQLTNVIPQSLTNSSPTMVLIDQSPTNALATGQYQTYTVSSTASNAPVRITLVWTDPPGNPAAGVALVNNLDLTVVDGTGTNVYIGNNFPSGAIYTTPSNPTNLLAGQSDNAAQNVYAVTGTSGPTYTAAGDSINNVQNVYINPTNTFKFPLTITVSGTRVNVNAVPGQTNNITQDYALVISTAPSTNLLTVSSNAIVTNFTPVLVTVASNGVPLLHQRVGANEPNLYNYFSGQTNGNSNQWHFFVFTNYLLTNGQVGSNVAFATFDPPNLSIPRASGSADIDLYVSTNYSPLTNFQAFVQSAQTSLGRTGTESVIYSNSFVGQVFYIGVKSEDQQASDFGFYGIAQAAPFSTVNSDGSISASGTALPVFIPNAITPNPALVFAFLVNPNPLESTIRRATVTLGIEHGNPSDLYGSLQFNGTTVVLNHNSGPPGGFTNTYDDLQEDPSSGDITSDGPGSLAEYVGQNMQGLWLLTESDNALTLTGYVTQYTVTVDPQPPISGFFVTLGPDQWFDDYIPVPDDATNLIISALYENNGTNAAGVGPIGLFLTNVDNLSLSDYGSNNIAPPGGFISLGTNDPVPGWPGSPPLAGGTWYYGIYNDGTAPVTLWVEVQIQQNLTPNLVQTYTNNDSIPLTTDAHTQSQVCITNLSDQQVMSLQVGLRVNDTNLDDLVISLISPQGTSVLLFENRGGTSANALGETLVSTNGAVTNVVYTVFTEDTNLATDPIKFAVPPYSDDAVISNASTLWSNSFETVAPGVYTNDNTNAVYLEGWLVTNNVVSIQTTNGMGYLTNYEVGIVTNIDTLITNIVTNSVTNMVTNITDLGTNYLALTSGRIVQTFGGTNNLPGSTNYQFDIPGGFSITNGQPYQIQFYAKPMGIVDWWPGDQDAEDIIGTNDGVATNILYDTGEVDHAFTFQGLPYTNSMVSFGTNAANFGTNDFSVDFWIKTASSNSIVLEKATNCNEDSNYFGIFLTTNGNISYVQSIDTNATNFILTGMGSNLVNDGLIYHHVALTREASVVSLYIDGLSNAIATNVPIFSITNTNALVAGVSVCTSNAPFIGDLDELDLYDRALSPAEVFAIYHAGSLGKYSTNSLLPNFNLTIDGVSTNNIEFTNASGDWQLFTNSFIATNNEVTIEFQGNTLGVLLDDIQLIQLPATNYNNYFLPEEPLSPLIGQNPSGCWTLDVWDTRQDSANPTDGELLSWTLQVTTSSTNAVLNVLTNDVPTIITNAASGSMTYFAVDVPYYVTSATNILAVISNSGPYTLYFNQNALPTGGGPGDVVLASGVTTNSTNTLATEGAPPALLPGQRYFMGVQNNGAAAGAFSLEVEFNGTTNFIMPLTNAVAVTNVLGTNTMGTNTTGTNATLVDYFSFVVPTNAVMVTFQVLNPTNGEADLYAREGLPLPDPSSFDYASRNAGSNDQFIVVTTNSEPVALPVQSTNDPVPTASIWYLAVYNYAAVSNVGYTVVATYVTTNEPTNLLQIIPLANGVAQTNTAVPGYPTNILYSFTVTGSPAGIQFTVTNLTNVGNVELLADLDNFPTPEEFYSGSFNPGTNNQLVQIGTNSTTTNLNGTWYLSVPNTSDTNVSYSIEATNFLSGPVTNAPLVVSGSVTSHPGSFALSVSSVTPGKTYEVEMSTNLITWTFVTNITATSNSITYIAPMTGQSAVFYRVLPYSSAPLDVGGSVSPSTHGFTIDWTAIPNEPYEIDVSSNLINWTTLTNITPGSTTGTFTDPSSVSNNITRFYRILPP
jgi:subtilisin-like proprotein convertase family protein